MNERLRTLTVERTQFIKHLITHGKAGERQRERERAM